MSSPLRIRLTAWYVGTFCLVLVLFSAGVYFLVSHILRNRLDANLRLALQLTSSTLARQSTALPRGRTSHDDVKSLANSLDESRFTGQTVLLVAANGELLAQKPVRSGTFVRLPTFPVRASSSPQFYELPESNPEADDGCRGTYQFAPFISEGSAPILFVVTSTESVKDQLDTLENVLAIAVIVALFATGGGGWMLAGKSLAPVAAMAIATERITAHSLDERLPVTTNDELGRLAARFNDLLTRLRDSFQQQRQFMADASHELRTPLSVARTAAEVVLSKASRSESEYREALRVIGKQVSRLARIVEDMFVLARADMDQIPLNISDLYLDEVIFDVVRASNVLAQQKGVDVSLLRSPEAPYRGDECLLRQMISNLVDNAVKFTPKGGKIQVRLKHSEVGYEIRVIDTGCGITPDLQSRVFDRFFRVAPENASAMVGAGLGLAIARSIAELHHGRLTLEDSGPEGSTFCASLPWSEEPV